MRIKGVETERFQDYKYPSMFIAFPYCSFKCEKECGMRVCQNSTLAQASNIRIDPKKIVERYKNNPISKAIVFGGLEPFDSWRDLEALIGLLRTQTSDDIVIYTGYKEEEIKNLIQCLCVYRNIIVKFGRFIPDQKPHYDEVLGVNLQSDNQYAERIS